jgi:hypothetical protein
MDEWGLVNMVTNTDPVKCREFLDYLRSYCIFKKNYAA